MSKSDVMAFPSGDFVYGMTLRDWLAGQALAGIAANKNILDTSSFRDIAEGVRAGRPLADASFALADAMLAAREQKA